MKQTVSIANKNERKEKKVVKKTKYSLWLVSIVVLMLIVTIHAFNGKTQVKTELPMTNEETFYQTEEIKEYETEQVEDEIFEQPTMECILTYVPSITEETEDIISATTKVAVLSPYAPSDTYYYDISYEDKVMIAKVVWAESRGECFEGKVAVAAVVLNRYFYGLDRDFDRDSITSIITQKYQFASIAKVTMKDLEKVPTCMEAVEAACKGWDPTLQLFPNGALYFYAPKHISKEEAEKREGIETLPIGNHNFHYELKS